MKPSPHPPFYKPYILRIWGEFATQPHSVVWRFVLEDVETGQRYGFATLEQLVTTVSQQLEGMTQDLPTLH